MPDEQRSRSGLLGHQLQCLCLQAEGVAVGKSLECVARHRLAEVEAVDELVYKTRVPLESDSAIIAVKMAAAHA